MCQPIKFDVCQDGVYTLHSWINGHDAEEIVTKLPEAEQYILGITSVEILKIIHSIPASLNQESWYDRFSRKTNNKIKSYFYTISQTLYLFRPTKYILNQERFHG